MIARDTHPWTVYYVAVVPTLWTILSWAFLNPFKGNQNVKVETKSNILKKKQTHDKTSRLRNRTALFILATWTLIDCVTPDQEKLVVMIDNDYDYDVGSLAYSHKML